jgi:hypothetical protein
MLLGYNRYIHIHPVGVLLDLLKLQLVGDRENATLMCTNMTASNFSLFSYSDIYRAVAGYCEFLPRPVASAPGDHSIMALYLTCNVFGKHY